MSHRRRSNRGSRHELRVGHFARRSGRETNSEDERRRVRLLPFLRDCRPVTTVRVCGSCCSFRAACCDARTATTRIRGISRTAPTSRPQQVLDRLGELCACAARARRRPDDFRRRAHGAARFHPRHLRRRQGDGPAHRDPDIGLSGRPRRRCLPCRQSISSCSTSRAPIPTPTARSPAATSRRPCGLPSALRRWASPLGSGSRWCPADRRSRQCRGHRQIRRADEERRMGRGAAVPSDGCIQVEGDGPRIQARRYARGASPNWSSG